MLQVQAWDRREIHKNLSFSSFCCLCLNAKLDIPGILGDSTDENITKFLQGYASRK